MSWNRFVRISDGHWEYWSAETLGNLFTGNVAYGKIYGSRGGSIINYNHGNSANVKKRLNQKIINGYFHLSESNSPKVYDSEVGRLTSTNTQTVGWERYVRISGNIKEYWSVEKISQTGYGLRTAYGKINHPPIFKNYPSLEVIKGRIKYRTQIVGFQKLNTTTNPEVIDSDLINFVPGEIIIPQQRQRQNISISQIESYSTNNNGYIERYREGYVRPKHERLEPQIKNFGMANILSNEELKLKAKAFYENIDASMVAKKPTFENLSTEKVGYFNFVFDSRKTPIAVYEVYKNSNKSEFIYIKTDVQNYNEILKYILKQIAILSNENYSVINIRAKGRTLIQKIKDVTNASFDVNYIVNFNHEITLQRNRLLAMNITEGALPVRFLD